MEAALDEIVLYLLGEDWLSYENLDVIIKEIKAKYPPWLVYIVQHSF